MTLDGARTYINEIQLPGESETLYEMFCPVNSSAHYFNTNAQDNLEQAALLGYSISVSNNGLVFGEELDMYLYNSECLVPWSNDTSISNFQLDVSSHDFNLNVRKLTFYVILTRIKIRTVSLESSLSVLRNFAILTVQNALREDSLNVPRRVVVFVERTRASTG